MTHVSTILPSPMQQLGYIVSDTQPLATPSDGPHVGRTVSLERLNAGHAPDLWEAVKGNDSIWYYLFDGPYKDYEAFAKGVETMSQSPDYYIYAVMIQGKAMGRLSLTGLQSSPRICQVGHIVFSQSLQRSTEATEVFYLLLKIAFEDLRVRRLEWKCDVLNIPSKRAAQRLGFSFEGIFRKHMICRGRNRDTVWFSLLDDEWNGSAGQALQQWLQESNFDEEGKQKSSLEAIQAHLGFLPVKAPPVQSSSTDQRG